MNGENAGLQALRRDTYRILFLGVVVLVLSAFGMTAMLHSESSAILGPVFVYATICAGIIWLLPQHLPNTTFGPANRISLARGIIVSVLSAFIWHPPSAGTTQWIVVLLALGAVVLDGVDGAVARRRGVSSALGARLDGELDGLLTLILCGIAFQSDRVGGFVFVAGGLHYVFLGLRYLGWSAAEPLTSNFRRQLIGVAATMLLIACCAPSLGSAIDSALALSAVVLLVYSFARDFYPFGIAMQTEDRVVSDK